MLENLEPRSKKESLNYNEELLQIRKDVSVQLTEIDLEEIELQAEITAMEIRREELLSHNHTNIVTSQCPTQLYTSLFVGIQEYKLVCVIELLNKNLQHIWHGI